uniref:Uncharacterized protein n=1 Tax=Oryza brachyantha TaxID=4533 RepID=J3MS60_ORYBR
MTFGLKLPQRREEASWHFLPGLQSRARPREIPSWRPAAVSDNDDDSWAFDSPHTAPTSSPGCSVGHLWEALAMAYRLGDGPTDPAVSNALVACHSRLGDISSRLSHF